MNSISYTGRTPITTISSESDREVPNSSHEDMHQTVDTNPQNQSGSSASPPDAPTRESAQTQPIPFSDDSIEIVGDEENPAPYRLPPNQKGEGPILGTGYPPIQGQITDVKYISQNKFTDDFRNAIVTAKILDTQEYKANGIDLRNGGKYQFSIAENYGALANGQKTEKFYTLELKAGKSRATSAAREKPTVNAYWAPQGSYVDIPIHPGPNDSNILFTPDFGGCHIAIDQINDDTYRVYHVEGGKENVQYNNLPDHGYGHVASMESRDYSQDTPNGQSASGHAYMIYEDGTWKIRWQKQHVVMANISRSGTYEKFTGLGADMEVHGEGILDVVSRTEPPRTPLTLRPVPPFLNDYVVTDVQFDSSASDANGLLHAGSKIYIEYEGKFFEVRSRGGKYYITHPTKAMERSQYEVRLLDKLKWELMDTIGLGGDIKARFNAQRKGGAALSMEANKEWEVIKRDNGVSGWQPDLVSIKPTQGGYHMDAASPDGQQRKTVMLRKNSALVAAAHYNRETVAAVSENFTEKNGRLAPRPGVTHHEVIRTLSMVDGAHTMHAGFSAMLQSGDQGVYAPSPELAAGMKAQFYVQLAQNVYGFVTGDVKALTTAIYTGLTDAGSLSNATVMLLDKVGNAVPLGKLIVAGNLLLTGASIGVNIFMLSHAKTDEEKVIYGTNLGLDGISLATFSVESIAQIAPNIMGAQFAEVAEFLGPIGVLLAGAGISANALISTFFAKARKILANGAQFTKEVNAYKIGYVVDPQNHQLEPAGPVIVTHLNLRNGTVHLGSPKIYAVDNSHSGDPQAILDERQSIDVGQLLKLPSQKPLPVSDKASAIQLPGMPEHTYIPQYDWLPDSTNRDDAELQKFKELQKITGGKFIESEWVAVFQKVVANLEPRYHDTRIRVTLGSMSSPLIIDEMGGWGKYITYDIEGRAAQYDLYLNDGPSITLSSDRRSGSSTWVLHTDNLEDADNIEAQAGKLTIGGVVVQVKGNEAIYVSNKAGERYQVDLGTGQLSLEVIRAGDYADLNALTTRLQSLRDQGRLKPYAVVRIDGTSSKRHVGRGLFYKPEDSGFVAIPVDGKDHGDELYEIPIQSADIVITPSERRRKALEAQAKATRLKAQLDSAREEHAHHPRAFWSARPKANSNDITDFEHTPKVGENGYASNNEGIYADYLRAQYSADYQIARLTGNYTDEEYRMLEQLLPDEDREFSQKGKRQTPVSRIGINGYPSDDVLVIGDLKNNRSLILYVPDAEPQFRVFRATPYASLNLLQYIRNQAKTEDGLKFLQNHFPVAYRKSDYSIIFGHTGTDEGLEKIGNGQWDLTNINLDKFSIDDEKDIFVMLAKIKRESEDQTAE
ncbi:TcdA/TcdB pore-forming domain-containing protein [Burkholderia pyrrocinia]|uniref:TcdA/TcdB pore-forming domain-containing protein n=1 Tax=Burkholderia pyrrocinia TaxID=60550 RepID=UPI0015895A49|nr:TcdA/TcdB pore-forming domain-containing protein [Burkholderia pyrrocinia]